MNEVFDGVWIASIEEVAEEPTNRFDAVISVCQDNVFENISNETYCCQVYLADDEQSAERWGGSCSYTRFATAADLVLGTLQDENTEEILVHCHHGKHRSSTVVAAAKAVQMDAPLRWAMEVVSYFNPRAEFRGTILDHAERYVEEASSADGIEPAPRFP